MGVTEIYNGNPFQDVMSQEAYAFGGKRIAVDFSSSNAAVIQLTLETQIPSEVNERQPLVLGLAVDDSFATADEIITGSDRSAVDPSGAYRNLDIYNYVA